MLWRRYLDFYENLAYVPRSPENFQHQDRHASKGWNYPCIKEGEIFTTRVGSDM